MMSLICGKLIRQTSRYNKKETDFTDIENKLVVTSEEKEDGERQAKDRD